MVTSQSDGRIVVTTFRKANGIERELAGQRMYTMEYAATIRFEKGGWKGGDAFVGYFSSFAAVDRPPGGWGGFGKNWKFFEKHAEIQLTGEIDFEDTDNGWRSKALNVKTVKVVSNRPDEEYYDQFVGLWVNESAWPIKIIKDGGRYKLLNNYNDTTTLLDPENQALKFSELGMPAYLYVDPPKRQLFSEGVTFARMDDEAAYARLRAAAVSPATNAVTQSVPTDQGQQADNVFSIRGVIDDPDGYTNVRSAKAASSQVIAVVRAGEEFATFQQTGDWWQVKTSAGVVGYMHATRIRIQR
jgi:hypothetical protein